MYLHSVAMQSQGLGLVVGLGPTNLSVSHALAIDHLFLDPD